MSEIRPFSIAASDEELEDLRRRLQATRWPDREPVEDWSQGMPLEYAQEVCRYWAESPTTGVSGRRSLIDFLSFGRKSMALVIHFIHARSPEDECASAGAMTHGWPGSIVEFQKVIGPLSDPVAHGGAADRRISRGLSVSSRLWIFGQASRTLDGTSSGSPIPGASDAATGLPPLRRSRGRLGCDGDDLYRPARSGSLRGDPSQYADLSAGPSDPGRPHRS